MWELQASQMPHTIDLLFSFQSVLKLTRLRSSLLQYEWWKLSSISHVLVKVMGFSQYRLAK